MGLQVKPVNPKGNQPWVFTGRTDAEAEAPIIWPPDTKSRLTGKDPDDGKDWGQEEKGATEDGMVGWHQWLSGDEFEQTLGDGEGQGNLVCCSSWGRKESDTILQLNNEKGIASGKAETKKEGIGILWKLCGDRKKKCRERARSD